MTGESHACNDGLTRMRHAPTGVEYATVGLLLVIITAGSFPLVRAGGNFVVGGLIILLLWVGLPVVVTGLLRGQSKWFAAAANVCTMLSAAIWPDPHNPHKLVDSGMWGFLAVMAGVGVCISLVVSAVVRRDPRQ
jgi:hypothetical protein